MEQERPYTETEPETAAETVETVPETAETPAETGEPAPKKPRESFFRRQRRELSDAWREIYCNSRARRIRTWQIAVFALLIVEVTVMAVALNPVYWIGTGLLVFWCVGQLFDRRPARHSVAAVVMSTLGPKILGESTGMKPLWIIFAITVGGSMFGVIGMFLGVPVVAILNYLLDLYLQFRLNKKNISEKAVDDAIKNMGLDD